jgi:hypothetical protein
MSIVERSPTPHAENAANRGSFEANGSRVSLVNLFLVGFGRFTTFLCVAAAAWGISAFLGFV